MSTVRDRLVEIIREELKGFNSPLYMSIHGPAIEARLSTAIEAEMVKATVDCNEDGCPHWDNCHDQTCPTIKGFIVEGE